MAKKTKVIKMHHRFKLDIGVVIFLIIIIYVVFNVFDYLTSSRIAEYEVGQGTIATNYVYHGLILRDETVVYAGQSGYINHYLKNASKASVNDVIYSIDTDGGLSKKITTAASDGTNLDTQTLSEISGKLDSFRNSYDLNSFSAVNAFKNEITSQLSQTLSVNALQTLEEDVDLAEANNTFHKKKTEKPGVIVYYTDGYETVTPDNFTSDHFNLTDYASVALENNAQVEAADPAYKRIGSEAWNIIIPVSEEVVKQLEEDEYIRIRFCKDNYTISVPFSVIKKDGTSYLNLSLRTAMIRYVNDRFVDIELVVSQEAGLKIPNSAITSKEFYTIPKEYFTKQDSTEPGLLIQKNAGKTELTLVTPTIYYENEDYYYVDDEFVSAGDIVVKNDSVDTYSIGKDVGELTGVYNINKGYAVFKQINILSRNENYSIVEMKTVYGIALYDHIALEGGKVKENQLVIK